MEILHKNGKLDFHLKNAFIVNSEKRQSFKTAQDELEGRVIK